MTAAPKDLFSTDEIWSPVTGFPGYMVSNKGRVLSYIHKKYKEAGFILKPTRVKKRLNVVFLYKDKIRYERSINALVKAHFADMVH